MANSFEIAELKNKQNGQSGRLRNLSPVSFVRDASLPNTACRLIKTVAANVKCKRKQHTAKGGGQRANSSNHPRRIAILVFHLCGFVTKALVSGPRLRDFGVTRVRGCSL